MRWTVKEAAQELGVSEVTLYKQRERRILLGRFFTQDSDGLFRADAASLKAYAQELAARPKSLASGRDHKIGAWFSDVEVAKLKANAGQRTLADYIRWRCL